MILSFNIEYRTAWGEEIRVAGSTPRLGEGCPDKAYPLHTADGIHWTADVEMDVPENRIVHYRYFVWRKGCIERCEWDGLPRTLHVGDASDHVYRLLDCWKDLPEQAYFYTSAFTESLMARSARKPVPLKLRQSLCLKVYAPLADKDCCVGICGNHPLLGAWNPDQAVWMSDADFPEWQAEINTAALEDCHLEYKFILYNQKEQRLVAWENGPNRSLSLLPHEGETWVVGDRYAAFPLPAWKGTGVAIPVFSLRSEGSWGIGDFGDLKRMVDWAASTRQQVVQILPINDTTMTHQWTDSYPYNAISIYALQPLYLDIRQLGLLDNAEKRKELEQRRQALNALPQVDYEAVDHLKWEYYRLMFRQEGAAVLDSDGFRQFMADNKEWLRPYSVYSYLRDLYETPDFRQWPQYAVYDAAAIEKLCLPDAAEYPQIALYYYVQYQLHLQLLEVSRHARAHGVVLKGDIPIGISRNSVEAWKEPHYFNMNGQAGAPPDDFSVNGQNWGFPTYNWEVMEQDGYAWWMKRFRKMATYFDAYRIDHILGFFRIWEIPMNAVHGLLGQFVPALPMTREEIESYGLPFREDFFLEPYIHESFLEKIFGPHVTYVKQTFLEPSGGDGFFRMKPEYDTQRKVEACFAGKTDHDSLWIRDGLYALISDVLFLPDRRNPHTYHPRIAVQFDFVYEALSDREKAAFNRLYDDYFYRRHNEFWRQQAMKKLPKLTESTRMLVCGEDLGMIPDCVAWVMQDLRILSLEIQRMSKDPRQEFGHPETYPYRSVCTISTHDMSTLRGWWEEDQQQTQRFYNTMLGHEGEAPAGATGAICEEVVRRHLESGSMLSILSLQDWMSIDEHWRNPDVEAERINVPANPRHYWRYRMHLTLEQLMQADSLNQKIRRLIAETRSTLG